MRRLKISQVHMAWSSTMGRFRLAQALFEDGFVRHEDLFFQGVAAINQGFTLGFQLWSTQPPILFLFT